MIKEQDQTFSSSFCASSPLSSSNISRIIPRLRPMVLKTLAPERQYNDAVAHPTICLRPVLYSLIELLPVQHLIHCLSIEVKRADTEVLTKELGGLQLER